jgi:hypothetical protein
MSSSIATALIRSTFSKMTTEMNQLEGWLLSLQSGTPMPPLEGVADVTVQLRQVAECMEAQQLALQRLTTMMEAQDLILQRLSTRVEILEEAQQPTHEVHIAEEWDATTAAIDPTAYQVIKEEETVEAAEEAPVKAPIVIPTIRVATEELCAPIVIPTAPAAPVAVAAPAAPVATPAAPAEPQESEEEEEEEEEAEDDGVEYEAVTFKDVTYYKDPEGFIYSVDEEGQPSDNPVGVWKDKTKTVAFYRKA